MASTGSITTNGELAIVIAAHNRPASLQRLLDSVLAADIHEGTPLIISIDGGGEHLHDVQSIANATEWPHGELVVIEHDHCGLVEHFLRCGDLTQKHGSVILLEDDLIVGVGFQRWASAALEASAPDDRIAGVSLAAPFFDGYRHLPFEPVSDGFDGMYLQVPWYDGMAWTSEKWQRSRIHDVTNTTHVHASLDTLDSDEWFPHAIRYLVETNRYYLLPRQAHATNMGAPGAHFDKATDYFQVPITLRSANEWSLGSLDESLAVYDDHMELAAAVVGKLVPSLADIEIAVDLLGTRDLSQVATSHVLTTRQVRKAVSTWGAVLHPLIANVVFGIEGDGIRLALTEEVIDSTASSNASLATLTYHAERGRSMSMRAKVESLAGDLKRRVTRGR